MFDQIVAVTLNPSLDVTLWIDGCDFEEPNLCQREKIYAGGKSLNVVRTLRRLHTPAELIGLIGSQNRTRLTDLLEQDRVWGDWVSVDGAVRENLTVVFSEGKTLKIDRAGFSVTPDQMSELSLLLDSRLHSAAANLAVFSGSLPPNISPADYRRLICRAQKAGAKAAIDVNFFSEEDMKQIRPFIFKPNCCEAKRLLGNPDMSREKLLSRMMELSAFVTHILLSCGKDGLYYFKSGNIFHLVVPSVKTISAVGAGDSVLAGFIAGLQAGKEPLDSAIYAAACGTAAVTCEGTEAVSYELVKQYEKLISCQKIK